MGRLSEKSQYRFRRPAWNRHALVAAVAALTVLWGGRAFAQAGGQMIGLGISQPRVILTTGQFVGPSGDAGETLEVFSAPSLFGGVISSRVATSVQGRSGVIAADVDTSVLHVLALTGQVAPTDGAVFSGFTLPSVHGGRVNFAAAVNGAIAPTRVLESDLSGLLRHATGAADVMSVHAGPGFSTILTSSPAGDGSQVLLRSDGEMSNIELARSATVLDGSPLGAITGVSSSDAGATVVRSSMVHGGVLIERIALVGPEASVMAVASLTDAVPDAPGGVAHHEHDGGDAVRHFGGFSVPVISRSSQIVAFVAGDEESEAGVYLAVPGSPGPTGEHAFAVSALADESLHVPGTAHHFLGFGDFVSVLEAVADPLAGPMVAFVGFGSGGEQQLLVWQNNVLATTAFAGQVIDGRTISTIAIGGEALSGNRLAFTADFSDGSSSVLIVTVPGPSGAVFMALVGGATVRSRRRRTSFLPQCHSSPGPVARARESSSFSESSCTSTVD